MPKVFQSYNTDYRIIVQNSGILTLDTTGCEQDGSGTVVITGNLEVRGQTTSVDSSNLNLSDNIILLSQGTQGAGLPPALPTSGIEIDRGTLDNARWIYDENIGWELGGLIGTGSFYAEQGSIKIPLTTPGINAQGTLYIDTGAGAISVTNTPDYETRIFNYDSTNTVIEPDENGFFVKDDDYIPNTKAVKDFVDYNFRRRAVPKIGEGDTRAEAIDEIHPLLDILAINKLEDTVRITTQGNHGFIESDIVNISEVDANGNALENLNQNNIEIRRVINQNVVELNIALPEDANATNYVTGSGVISKVSIEETRIEIEVEGNIISNFYENRFNIGPIEFQDNEITTLDSNRDLILKSPGTGSIAVDDSLHILPLPYDDDPDNLPSGVNEGVKLYTTDAGSGTVGLYFVNKENQRDELISKNRSLLFSMLF